MSGLVVAVLGEAFGEEFVGKHAGLGQAVHAFIDADVDVAVVGKGEEIVFGKDLVGKKVDWDAHVFRSVHWSV